MTTKPQQIQDVYPNLRALANVDWKDVSAAMLQSFNDLVGEAGRTAVIFSGYRTDAYSASVGGFAGDPHTRRIAVDARDFKTGKPIGQVIPALSFTTHGLITGNQPNFYKGRPDPAHVQLAAEAKSGDSGAGGSARVPITQSGHVTPEAVAAAATASGVDPFLFEGLVQVESRYAAEARSSAGAVGPAQVVGGPTDLWQNLLAGASILHDDIARFGGDIRLGLAAYNAGPGAVERYHGIPPFKETQAYVPAVLQYAERFRKEGPDRAADDIRALNKIPPLTASSSSSGDGSSGGGGFDAGDIVDAAGNVIGRMPIIPGGPTIGDVGGVGGVLKGINAVGDFFARLVKILFDPVRVLELLGGAILVVLGVLVLTRWVSSSAGVRTTVADAAKYELGPLRVASPALKLT